MALPWVWLNDGVQGLFTWPFRGGGDLELVSSSCSIGASRDSCDARASSLPSSKVIGKDRSFRAKESVCCSSSVCCYRSSNGSPDGLGLSGTLSHRSEFDLCKFPQAA